MRFDVKAVSRRDGVVSLPCEAADAQQAAQQLRRQGYAVLAVHPRAPAWRAGIARRPGFPLLLTSQELIALLKAGLNLVEAVETLAEKDAPGEVKHILAQVVAALREGLPLSQALQQFPAAFPPLYIATVRAAERTGDLAEALGRFVAYQSQLESLRQRMTSAAVYPALLLGVGFLVVLFLLGYVVPRFARIYADMGSDLPLLSRLLLEWGALVEAHGPLLLAFLAGLVALAASGAGRRAVRAWLARLLWHAPVVGERLRIYQLARFYRTLGMLLRSGTPVVAALDMSADLLPGALRGRSRQVVVSLREGLSISQAMQSHALTTPVSLRMLRVGERTGNMAEMMERIAAFYEDEMGRWVDWATRLFEPLLMAFIGLAIGVVVILMYLPIFELAGSVQ
ncbi:MAG: type II secretion system F family protein [Pseudomonadota bacterium]